jgi:hypothetical protein
MPQQQQKQQQGPPSNEQLTQFLMMTKGLNREGATTEVMADPEKIKADFEKLKKFMETGSNGGNGKEEEQQKSGQQQHGQQEQSKSGQPGKETKY